jgi:hypothetical protein
VKKVKVTNQRFNTIKSQLKNKRNDPARIAEAHGLKLSTVRVIRGCKDYATYQQRTSQKARDAVKAQDSLLDTNLTEEQATAILEMATDLQTALDQNKTLERTLIARDTMIEKKDQAILELKAKLQTASDVHGIIEKAQTERKLKRLRKLHFWEKK